jgi:hypothetical protein
MIHQSSLREKRPDFVQALGMRIGRCFGKYEREATFIAGLLAFFLFALVNIALLFFGN